MIAMTVAVTGAMALSRAGILHIYVFYALLAAMHVWIFSGIGIRIYNLKKK